MEITPTAAATLVRLYLQTLGLALLFVGTGQFLHRWTFPRAAPDGAALRWARGYFVGAMAFLPAFLFLSRVLGATYALWTVIALMGTLTLTEVARARPVAPVAAACTAGALLLLVAAYSVTTAALWLLPLPPPREVLLFTHFGSIHAGRYANYAVFIADHDRIPFLAQNGGQSILASLHLLLGVQAPLASLSVWLPFSLAFLSLLVFGVFRSASFAVLPCAAAAFMVMFCNVAISAIHLLVFDNGSPIAFIGYTDMALAVGTFLLFCRWFQERLAGPDAPARRELAFPVLLGMSWAWFAPQNVVLAAAGGATAALLWMRRGAGRAPHRLFAPAALAFGVALAIGATQLGAFLPKPLREDTGYWTQDVTPTLLLRPYIQYLRGLWTAPTWKENEPGVYEHVYEQASPMGRDEVFRRLEWLAEENFWDSIRVYGFPLLGLGLLWACIRRVRDIPGEPTEEWLAWWALALGSFGAGYAITYLLELGAMKWWLTRFLVPGCAMALTCLGFAALRCLAPLGAVKRAAAWTLLLAATTFGPVTELAAVTYRNFVTTLHVDPIGTRVSLLAERKGPFILDTMKPLPGSGRPGERGGLFVVGGPGQRPGLALESPPLPLAAGSRRVGVRIDSIGAGPADAALLETDIVDAAGTVLARRTFARRDLDQGADGAWAWLDFALPEVKGARIRLWSRADAGFRVTAMRIERR